MPPLLRDLLRPRRRTLAAILAAMLVQMVMSIAAPWPLKIVIDKVIGTHRQFHWIDMILRTLGANNKMAIALAAGIATIVIALVAGAAMYIGNYFTETLSQSIGNDLRVRLYQQLQQLSLAYYDTTRLGTILSTLTTDFTTIELRVGVDPQHRHEYRDGGRDDHCDLVVPVGFRVDCAGVYPAVGHLYVAHQQSRPARQPHP